MKTRSILFVLLLLGSACRKEEVAHSQFAITDRKDAASPAALAQSVAEAPARNAASAFPRMIVRTADVRIIVDDTQKTVDALTKSIEAMGGYVAGSNVWREGELLRAKLTLRVPADRLTATLAAVRGLARRVDHEAITSDEVTQEFVDLSSQVRNLEATEEELRQLLVTARQNSKKASDVLEVHQQLVMIRGQIEQARGRMRYLEQVSSMSAVTVEVAPDAIVQPVVEAGWRPVVVAREAMRALVAVLQTGATAAIWLAIYVLPIIAILAMLAAAVWAVARKVRTREA